MSFGNMNIAFLSMLFGALGVSAVIFDSVDQSKGLAAASRIFAAIDDSASSSLDPLKPTGLRPNERAQGLLDIKNVSFSYPTRPEIIVCKKYSLTIQPGEVVALVGPSGCGKSTMMSLLLRFYDPTHGEILLDGRNIRSLNVRWLRAQIGYVGQEPVLFRGSVANNIAMGRASHELDSVVSFEELWQQLHSSNMTSLGRSMHIHKFRSNGYSAMPTSDPETVPISPDEDVISAAKESNAHNFIMSFPNGYSTDVGEGSVAISGGQKQRIAIARALVKHPAILLLDEATSALDSTSERLVQESIDKLQQSRMQTTIVIAHRLSTIRNADKIAIINNGHVEDIGMHETLLEKGGLYAQLWNLQNDRK